MGDCPRPSGGRGRQEGYRGTLGETDKCNLLIMVVFRGYMSCTCQNSTVVEI